MSSSFASKPKDNARDIYEMGLREQAAGRLDAAISLFDTALRIRPDFPEALCSGGYILQNSGHIDGALAFYGRAIELKPDYFDALYNRGFILYGMKRFEDAAAHFERAHLARPRDADALANLGAALYRIGRFEDAVKNLRKALKFDPKLTEAELNLGSALRRLGREDQAGETFRQALSRHPDSAEAWCGLGIVARNQGRYDEAMAAYDKALALNPALEEALSSKACLHLLLGDFGNGWEGYEHRWIDTTRPLPISEARFDLSRPETIRGRTVLVLNDHGLGDTIQFFRYVLMLSRAGAEVTFAGPAKMRRLLALSGAQIDWRETNDFSGDFDAKIAISSLPRAFSTRLETIPAEVPYLEAEAERIAFWRARMPEPGLKVGICWRGSQDFRVDPRRSIPTASLAPLAEIADVQFYALHMDVAEGELPTTLAGKIKVFGDGFDRGPDAFVDTAAVMANLDLVITCDTSIAHLAGALGRPVWVALRHFAEWRWLTGRSDSPWYPTMQLKRCGSDHDWRALFATIADDIKMLQETEK